eukprot:764115-Hanusia_phi.AAC.1
MFVSGMICEYSVTILRPKQTERLGSKKVDFEASQHAGLAKKVLILFTAGIAQLYINDVLALNITQNRMVVAAPLESGFHKVAGVKHVCKGLILFPRPGTRPTQ